MLYITSLNSGSNGNCYYLGNDEDAILVDAGLSCRETLKRMQQLGLSIDKVRAIFISHEHTDHIKGLLSLTNQFNIPVYCSPKTHLGALQGHIRSEAIYFYPGCPLWLGSLSITAFKKFHDAVEPHSFIIQSGEVCAGVFTDLGRCCTELKKYFALCHAAFLEANYDIDMLENGRYPWFLKNRIRGGLGHLSNKEALELFRSCKPEFMTHLLLSHLSADNNCPELILNTFLPYAQKTKISIAGRHAATPLFTIKPGQSKASRFVPIPVQMQLWA
ncbi:MAG: MBL fold metallo-hydrolase [Ferruginibacter sp.]